MRLVDVVVGVDFVEVELGGRELEVPWREQRDCVEVHLGVDGVEKALAVCVVDAVALGAEVFELGFVEELVGGVGGGVCMGCSGSLS